MPSANIFPMKKDSTISKAKDRLKQILLEKSYLRGGQYELASGEVSDVYFDVKKTSLDPEGSTLAAIIMLDMLKSSGVKAVGGLATGACPIVSAVNVISYDKGTPINGFFVRDKKKTHGLKQNIEGCDLKKGDKIAILDDVATKGGSMIDAIVPLEELGCEIVRTIVVVDREQGAKEKLAEKGYKLESIFTRSDLEK